MAIAQTRLVRLVNLRPGTKLQLAGPGFPVSQVPIDMELDEMEITALNTRPELREQDYAKRISHTETRKEMLRMFPGLEFNIGAHNDNNKFLFHNSWADTGLRLSWNLFNLVSQPQIRNLRQSEEELGDARRRALSMSVMTQVRLAAQNYQIEQQKLIQSARLSHVDEDLFNLVNGTKMTRTKFDVVQARSAWLVSKVREEIARAEVQNSMARLLDSMGVDPIPNVVEDDSLAGLSQAIRARWNMLSMHYFAAYDPAIDAAIGHSMQTEVDIEPASNMTGTAKTMSLEMTTDVTTQIEEVKTTVYTPSVQNTDSGFIVTGSLDSEPSHVVTNSTVLKTVEELNTSSASTTTQ